MEITLHTALNEKYSGQKMEVKVTESIYAQHCFEITQADDRIWLFASRAQLEQIFGTLNNYFEAERNAEMRSETDMDKVISLS